MYVTSRGTFRLLRDCPHVSDNAVVQFVPWCFLWKIHIVERVLLQAMTVTNRTTGAAYIGYC